MILSTASSSDEGIRSVPEVLALPVAAGVPGYTAWERESVGSVEGGEG